MISIPFIFPSYADRLNNAHAQHDFLKQIPRMADITLPSNSLDWKSNKLDLPADSKIWNDVNLSGKLEWPLYAEEPHYILIRSDGKDSHHLGIVYFRTKQQQHQLLLSNTSISYRQISRWFACVTPTTKFYRLFISFGTRIDEWIHHYFDRLLFIHTAL